MRTSFAFTLEVGFNGAIIDYSRGYTVEWRCPHTHKYQDQAQACAGRSLRRKQRSGHYNLGTFVTRKKVKK